MGQSIDWLKISTERKQTLDKKSKHFLFLCSQLLGIVLHCSKMGRVDQEKKKKKKEVKEKKKN